MGNTIGGRTVKGRTVKDVKCDEREAAISAPRDAEMEMTEEEPEAEEVTEEEPEAVKRKESMLIAIYPILYLSKQYAVGERLPASDHEMVNAWIEAGTASWQDGGLE